MTEIKKYLDFGVNYFERLGVCVAIFAGGGAMVKYAITLSPYFPYFAIVLGIFLMIVSIIIAVLTAIDFLLSALANVKGNSYTAITIWVLMTFLVIIITMMFLGVAIQSALTALDEPDKEIQTQKKQEADCATSTPASQAETKVLITNPPNAGSHYRTVDTLNLRVLSSVSSTRISILSPGTIVTTTGEREGDWWRVVVQIHGNQVEGWTSSLWLRLMDEQFR